MATVTTSIGTALGSAGNGVVTLTSGSTSVTGSGTDFTSKFTGGTAPPQAVEIPIGGGTYYTVKSVESDTALTLVSDPGVSASMQSWKVGTRDYSTIDAWDADLDNTAIYSSSDTGQGECYADSAFSQSGYQRLEGGITVGLSKIILTVPVGQRHDGTADSGAKVNLTSGGRFVLWYQSAGGPPRTMEWLELDGGDSEQNFGSNSFIVGISTVGQPGTVSHLLIHGCHNTRVNNGNMYGMIAGNISQPGGIFDNIIYDCSGRLQTPGIGGSSNGIICNNTVYKIGMTYTSYAGDGSREAIGILCPATCVIKNNIAIGTYFEDDGHDHEKYDYLVSGAGTVGTYNISGDSTASGSDSITGVSTASLFISTTSGSEDLHILRSSSAVGAGEDLGTSVTSGSATLGGSTYGSPINRDINHGDRNSRAMAWDIGASQHSIISTVGTSSRDYSTVAAWEADLDDGTYYGNGSIARGEMYPDSTFSTNFGQVGGGSTIGLVCKVLTAAAAHRHDGTESGSHVKVTQTNNITHAGAPWIVSWLDFSGTGTDNQFISGFHVAVTHCIIHDITMSGSGGGYPGSRCVTTGIICNNIIYNIDSTTYSSSGTGYYTYHYGIWQRGTHYLCDNNTVYKVHSTNTFGGGQFVKGIVKDDSSGTADSFLRNNIVVGSATDTEGTNGANAKDFNDSPTATFTNNISSDDTADGSNSITDTAASTLFMSNAGGSEDLHLKAGAAAIGAGADLGTVYSVTAGNATIEAGWDMGPQFDINNRDRDAEGDTWDIGAHQFVAAAATTNTAFMFFVD